MDAGTHQIMKSTSSALLSSSIITLNVRAAYIHIDSPAQLIIVGAQNATGSDRNTKCVANFTAHECNGELEGHG